MVVLPFPFFTFSKKLSTQQGRNHFCKALIFENLPSIVDFIVEYVPF